MEHHLYLDAPSLVYRAFFALPKSMVDAEGRSVNAVRGFMDMLATLLVERKPDGVVCAFDLDWRPAFRVAAYPGYKSERPDDPPELPWQFELLDEVLDAAGVPRAGADGLEADDVLATMVEELPSGRHVSLVTGDRDLLCLVRDDRVKLLFPVKGVKEMTEFDEAAVEAKYGIPPRLYAEFATLRGDPSDGLPGVAGIGPVRATKLLCEYGSIDAIFESRNALPDKQRAAFEAAADYLSSMRTVVGLVRDADVTCTEAHPPDLALMETLSERHNLGGSATRLLAALG
jgi:5'-3' exonuclease